MTDFVNENETGLEEEKKTQYSEFVIKLGLEDVIPIEQDDGENPVVSIAYPKKYIEIMNYFRGILQINEISERALLLTEEVISLNQANYTAWYYRRHLIKEMMKDIYEEIQFTTEVAGSNPKNYQIWFHRRALIEVMSKKEKLEKAIIEEVILNEFQYINNLLLTDDAKNYHAWSQRQWLLKTFPEYMEMEWKYIDDLLDDDLRNNSAWNHRWFVLSHIHGDNDDDNNNNSSSSSSSNEKKMIITDDILNKEIVYTFSYIIKAINNESPWNYLRGLCRLYIMPNPGNDDNKYDDKNNNNNKKKNVFLHDIELLKEKTMEIYQNTWGQDGKGSIGKECIYCNTMLLEIMESESTIESLTNAIAIVEYLGNEIDPIRSKYWLGVRLVRLQNELLSKQ